MRKVTKDLRHNNQTRRITKFLIDKVIDNLNKELKVHLL